MTPRTLDLPGRPEATDEAAQTILAATQDPRQAATLAWRWARHCHPSDEQAAAETWRAVLEAGHIPHPDDLPATAEPKPKPAPKPGAEPATESAADDGTQPDDDDDGAEQPARAPVAAPDPEPLTRELAQQLAVLSERVEATEPHIAAPIAKWDPDETPVLAGQVAVAEYADLRQRAGPVRIILLLTEHGPIEAWCSWQQLSALIRAEELAHGRTIQPGDLVGIQARGKQRVGRSRSPSRLFTVAIEWAS